MPAYNAEKFIGESLNSIIKQTYDDWLVYVLDDASNDSTNKIVRDYAKKDPRIFLFKNDINLGISRTRNKLLKLVKTKYIAWLDSDDISMPNRLLSQIIFLEKNDSVFGLGGSRIIIDEAGNKISSIKNYEIETNFDYIKLKVVSENPFCNSTMTFRNQNYQLDDNFPPAEDFEFWSRLILIENKKIINKNEFYVKYRKHSNNTSNRSQTNQLSLNDRIISRNLNFIGLKVEKKTNYYLHHYLNPTSRITNIFKYLFNHLKLKVKIINKLNIKEVNLIIKYLKIVTRNVIISLIYKVYK